MKFTKELRFGSFGIEVYRLQEVLELLGISDFTPLGFFGSKTEEAVIAFQLKYGIEPAVDWYGNRIALVGPKTRAKLNELSSNLNSELIYFTALRQLNTDVTPNDNIPDEVACAETVEAIVYQATGYEIGANGSTYMMKAIFDSSPLWTKVEVPTRGTIILSATGHGNGNLAHGHVGIMGEIMPNFEDSVIMSNSSSDGLLRANYTVASWNARYKELGGFPVEFYQMNLI